MRGASDNIHITPGSFVPVTGYYQLVDHVGRPVAKPFHMHQGNRASPTPTIGWGWVLAWPGALKNAA